MKIFRSSAEQEYW